MDSHPFRLTLGQLARQPPGCQWVQISLCPLLVLPQPNYQATVRCKGVNRKTLLFSALSNSTSHCRTWGLKPGNSVWPLPASQKSTR